ncbi:MAG: PAS domain S-box protein [Clostridiales bacterium]|nr:PAS domain S-box protein [Clostridiales bacterium]
MRNNRSKEQKDAIVALPGSSSKNRYNLVLVCLIVLILTGAYLFYKWNRAREIISSEAIQLAESIESLLHVEHVENLSGAPEDIEKPEYIMTKKSLTSLVDNTAAIEFAYILGEKNNNIIFLVDSESPDSADYSPPGQLYYEADEADWQPFLLGETVLMEPKTDRWGTWVSVMVPIKDAQGGIVAVLGLDYPASEWKLDLWKLMLPEVIIVICILIIIAAFIRIWMQHLELKNITRKLAIDEALYRSVFSQAPIGIALVDGKSFISHSELGVNINPMFETILGRSSRDFDIISWEDITHPKDLQTDLEQFERFSNGEISGYSLEKRFLRPDGSSIWTNMTISRLTGLPNTGSMQLHLCLLEDVSARKEMERAKEESERSKTLLLSHLQGMAYRCKYDRDWTMEFVSSGCYKLTGYYPEDLINNNKLSFNDIIAPEYRDTLWDEWERAMKERLPFTFEYEIIKADGEHKWVLEKGEGVYDENGKIEALEGIIVDISDRKKIEDQLKQTLERTRAMIYNHEAVMLLIEPHSGKIIEANHAATVFYEYSREELLRMTIRDINTLDRDTVRELRMKALSRGQKHFTMPHRRKSGEIRIVDVYSSPVDYGDKKALFSILFDVTYREEIAKQNEYLAYHDHLTGLYNRRYLEKEFQKRVEDGEFPIALLLGDINGFKVLNDTFGHAKGDRVLIDVGESISKVVDESDVLARIGGDEFAIVVSGKTEAEIRKYLDRLEMISYNDLEGLPSDNLITISWGYGIQKRREDSIDVITEEAEAFMYNRKFYSHASSRSKTVDIIMETLFAKSGRDEKHSVRVGMLSEAIARKMNLNQMDIDKIRVAGFLHDIGKIGIDESILNKAGPLDGREWELMRLHPAKGSAILSNIREYQDISDIVLSHHERYDGMGYPNGLKGESIPLGARIISVADTFDALTNVRPYKAAVSPEEAIDEIARSSGTQLDPEIVSVFISEVDWR